MASDMRAVFRECFSHLSLRCYLAEFFSTFFFVFAAVGSTICARMLIPEETLDASSLLSTAMAQGFALFVAVYMASDVSGGHVNPAVTFAFAIGGHIKVPIAIFYWISQMIAATFACFIIQFASVDQAIPTTNISTKMTGFGASILECFTTFILVYTVHVAADPRTSKTKKSSSLVGSLAIGLAACSLILATGSLTGGSMNPARSFGPAVISGTYGNQAVYWVGPFLGAALAAIVHQNLVFPNVSGESDLVSGGNAGEAVIV